jgi:MFS family permease
MASADPDQAEAITAPSRVLRNRNFVTFWVGETLSLVGTQVSILAVPLTAILVLGASDEQVGLLRFVQLAPFVLLSLLFGVWVDRVRRRPMMLWANLARIGLVALVPVLAWVHVLDVPMLLLISGGIGVAAVLFDLCWMSYVPTLVADPRQYVEANAVMGISSSAVEVAGPGLAGVLVGWLTAPVALLVDAGSYLASVISLMLIRVEEPRPLAAGKRGIARELGHGLRWVLGEPVLRWLALIGFCCNFSMNAVWTMFLLYATRDLELPSRTIGLIFGLASIGGVVGALISRRVIARFPIGRVYLVAQSGLLLGPLLIVAAGGPLPVQIGLSVLSFFTTYLGLGVAGVIIVSLRQTITPQNMMGRMTAGFRMLLFGGGALGGLSAGLLSSGLGPGNALLVAAVGSASVVLALVGSPVSRLRALPAPAAEPAG